MTPRDFADTLALAPNGLGAAVTITTLNKRRLTVRTTDAHAASAVNIIATRWGLKVLTTRTDDWSFVLGITGFGRR